MQPSSLTPGRPGGDRATTALCCSSLMLRKGPASVDPWGGVCAACAQKALGLACAPGRAEALLQVTDCTWRALSPICLTRFGHRGCLACLCVRGDRCLIVETHTHAPVYPDRVLRTSSAAANRVDVARSSSRMLRSRAVTAAHPVRPSAGPSASVAPVTDAPTSPACEAAMWLTQCIAAMRAMQASWQTHGTLQPSVLSAPNQSACDGALSMLLVRMQVAACAAFSLTCCRGLEMDPCYQPLKALERAPSLSGGAQRPAAASSASHRPG